MRKRNYLGISLCMLGAVCLVAAVIFGVVRGNIVRKIEDEVLDLGDLVDYGEDHAKQLAEILAVGEAYEFAEVEGGGTKKYYFVVDERYNYIVRMTEGMAARLAASGEMLIHGVTREFTNDLRKVAVEWMEDENSENEITLENFRSYFGNVWLDATASTTELTPEMNTAIIASVVSGLIFGGAGIILLIKRRAE